MSFGPSILGVPAPSAPPPGTPPPGPPSPPVSSEDRLLVAFVYLSYFTGFWLVAPVIVYVFKRETSRFVAHHALRAVIVHLLAIPVFIVSAILYLFLAFGLAALLQSTGRGNDELHGLLVVVLSTAGWLLPGCLYLGLCVLATMRAAQGRLDTTSLLGRTVERWLGPDHRSVTAGRAPPSPTG